MIDLIVDGGMLRFRAAKGTQNLSSNGMQTGVIFGLVRCLKDLVVRLHPQRVIIAWDAGLCKHRVERLPGWRSRPRLSDEEVMPGVTRRSMWHQVDVAQDLLTCLGVRNLRVTGMECDDLVAMACSRATEHAIIHTRDRDYYQLLNDYISMYWDEYKTVQDFRKEFGFPPKLYPLYQALVGKPGNGVPGVKGIGKKTASRTMAGCESFDDWQKGHLSLFTDKQLEKIINAMDSVIVGYHCSVIPCQACADLAAKHVDEVCFGPKFSNLSMAQMMIEEFEMHSLLRDDTMETLGVLS